MPSRSKVFMAFLVSRSGSGVDPSDPGESRRPRSGSTGRSPRAGTLEEEPNRSVDVTDQRGEIVFDVLRTTEFARPLAGGELSRRVRRPPTLHVDGDLLDTRLEGIVGRRHK